MESIGQAEVIKETFSGRILLADWAEAVRAEIFLNRADYQQALELSTGLISQTKPIAKIIKTVSSAIPSPHPSLLAVFVSAPV